MLNSTTAIDSNTVPHFSEGTTANPNKSSSKVGQSFLDRRSGLTLNDAKIDSLVELEPRRRLVARISRNVSVGQLPDPFLLARDRPTLSDAGFADAEMLIVRPGELVVKITIDARKGCAGFGGVHVYTDDVDVLGTREPAPDAIYRVAILRLIRTPEHEDLGIGRDCIVISSPGRDEFHLR